MDVVYARDVEFPVQSALGYEFFERRQIDRQRLTFHQDTWEGCSCYLLVVPARLRTVRATSVMRYLCTSPFPVCPLAKRRRVYGRGLLEKLMKRLKNCWHHAQRHRSKFKSTGSDEAKVTLRWCPPFVIAKLVSQGFSSMPPRGKEPDIEGYFHPARRSDSIEKVAFATTHPYLRCEPPAAPLLAMLLELEREQRQRAGL